MQPLHMIMMMAPTLQRRHHDEYDILYIKDDKFVTFKNKIEDPEIIERDNLRISQHSEACKKALKEGLPVPPFEYAQMDLLDVKGRQKVGFFEDLKDVEPLNVYLCNFEKEHDLEVNGYYIIDGEPVELVSLQKKEYGTKQDNILVFQKLRLEKPYSSQFRYKDIYEPQFIVHTYFRDWYERIKYSNVNMEKGLLVKEQHYMTYSDKYIGFKLGNKPVADVLNSLNNLYAEYIFEVDFGMIRYTEKFKAPFNPDELDFEPIQACEILTQHLCSDFEEFDLEDDGPLIH